jgi:hypothetical protein
VRKFSIALVVTLSAAVLALLTPVALKSASAANVQTIVVGLQIIWLAGLLWCFFAEKRSLWLLASVPFALFWPWVLLLLMTLGCGFQPCD